MDIGQLSVIMDAAQDLVDTGDASGCDQGVIVVCDDAFTHLKDLLDVAN